MQANVYARSRCVSIESRSARLDIEFHTYPSAITFTLRALARSNSSSSGGAIASPVYSSTRGRSCDNRTLAQHPRRVRLTTPHRAPGRLTSGLVALCVLVPSIGMRTAVGPLTSAFLVRLLPPETRGRTWGSLRTLFFTLGATGSTVMGLMADAGWFDVAFMALAALSALTLVLWWFIPPSGRGARA